MVKEVKRGSSLWLKTKSPDCRDFGWQNGYGIFSIGFSQIESVRSYIAGQGDHHRKISFQDEFRLLLKRYRLNLTNGISIEFAIRSASRAGTCQGAMDRFVIVDRRCRCAQPPANG